MRLMTRVLLSTMTLCALLLSVSTATAGGPPGTVCAPYYNPSVKVKRLTFNVTLSDGQDYEQVGYLYYQGNLKHKPLQVAVHGGTYTHKYWDAPCINNRVYSYARYMARNGYAVLAVDQLGAGESDKPNGDFLNITEKSLATSQIIQAMQTKHNPSKQAFDKIALVGHSLGSVTSLRTIGLQGADVDAAVITGWLHAGNTSITPPEVFLSLITDPYTRWDDLLRAAIFYLPATTDPAVIAYDNANISQPLARGVTLDSATLGPNPANNGVAQVDVPVYLQVGDQDLLFIMPSGALAEPALFTSAPSVELDIVNNTGHNINLHTTNFAAWNRIRLFLNDKLSSHCN